jgi:hypothetical protein
LQTLTTASSPALTPALSSPAVQSALENAPAGDLAQISAQAIALQETNLLFGSSDGTEAGIFSTADNLWSLLAQEQTANLPANTAASPEIQSQAQQVQAILGIPSNPAPPGSLVDLLG